MSFRKPKVSISPGPKIEKFGKKQGYILRKFRKNPNSKFVAKILKRSK